MHRDGSREVAQGTGAATPTRPVHALAFQHSIAMMIVSNGVCVRRGCYAAAASAFASAVYKRLHGQYIMYCACRPAAPWERR